MAKGNNGIADVDDAPSFGDRLKVEFALAISRLMERYDLTPLQAAAIMKAGVTDVDNILCGRLDGFTVDWLLKALRILRWRVLTSALPSSFTPH